MSYPVAISLRKPQLDDTMPIAKVVPIRSVALARLDDEIERHAERIRASAAELVPARSVFGPIRYGVRPGSTVTGRLPQLHNHGLPVMHLAEKAAKTEKIEMVEEPASEVEGFEETLAEPTDFEGQQRLATKVQKLKAHLGVIVWYGKHTEEFWVMDAAGLRSFGSISEMYTSMKW